MSSLLHDAWERIQPALRARVGDAAHEAWLQGLRPLTMERSICYLEAKNRLVAERVERMFAAPLREALSDEFHTAVDVEVVPAPESLLPDRLEVGPLLPILDDSNQAAYLTLRALLEEKHVAGAKLFVFHGPEGVGKSYLLRWFTAHLKAQPKVFDGLQLLHAMQACLRDRRLPALRAELTRDVVLMIDGVHRLSGHVRLQQELAQIIEARAQATQPMILTSRFHPRDIWNADAGLVSRMLAGYVTRIDRPGPKARLQFLRALEGTASRNGRAADVERIAREMRGSWVDVRRAWALDKQGHAGHVGGRYLQLIDPGAIYRRLRDRVSQRLDIPVEKILDHSQSRRTSFARQVLAWLCVHEGLSQAETGRHMGGRSRAAISYSVHALEQRMQKSPEVKAQVEGLL